MDRFEQLDVTAFDRYFNGKEHKRSVELYLKLADLFINSLEEKLVELNHALQSLQLEDAREIAHRIRNLLLSLGGSDLAKVFHEIECVRTYEAAQEQIKLLATSKQELQQFLDELNAWMIALEASIHPWH